MGLFTPAAGAAVADDEVDMQAVGQVFEHVHVRVIWRSQSDRSCHEAPRSRNFTKLVKHALYVPLE